MGFKKIFLFFILTAVFLCGGRKADALDVPTKRVEDDSALRTAIKDVWFLETPNKTLALKPFSRSLPGGAKVEVRIEANKSEFAVVLARERNKAYPGWAQGSWSLTRRRDTGEALRIRAFLRSDPNMYVQFRPMSEDKSFVDVVIYEAYLLRSLPVPFSFDRLMTAPIEEVLSAMGDKFPRKYFDPVPALYKDTRNFVANVRKYLPNLAFQDDGAIDEAGNYVFIASGEKQSGDVGLNCSGFAKWVIDGLLRPITQNRLAIVPLKTPYGNRGNSLTAVYGESVDSFFGLDWVRNLAARAGSTLLSPNFGKQEEFEVRRWPFQYLTLRSNTGRVTESYAGFLEDAGFSVEGVHPLLYTLAVDEPGRIYLAAVNNQQGASGLRTYFHVAVLVPYFNEQGNFQVTLFESAEETSFSRFKTRYPSGTFVNLARIPLGARFEP
jgi:hypothetical protein